MSDVGKLSVEILELPRVRHVGPEVNIGQLGVGIHVVCTCDSYNSLARALSRKAISEFELRVLFQMSANDSASLCDSPMASDLGLHRALLHNGQQGVLETFRPYALPDGAWLEEVAARLRGPLP